jgi:hypothetical protein
MEQSLSFEINNHMANKEISGLLWKQKVRHYVHKSLPLLSVLNQINNFTLGQLNR